LPQALAKMNAATFYLWKRLKLSTAYSDDDSSSGLVTHNHKGAQRLCQVD